MSAVPNALSVLRALLAVPLVWALIVGAQAAAFAVFALAVATDVLDGRLARRLQRDPSTTAAVTVRGRPLGAYLDVGGDAVFLVSSLTASWALGALPGWVPLVAVAMLARFFASSPAAGLVYDPFGRHYGTILYVVLGSWLLGVPPAVRGAVLATVVVATVASLVGRSWFLAARASEGVGASGTARAPSVHRGSVEK